MKEDEAASKLVLSKYEMHKTKKAARKGKGDAARKPKATDDKNASGRRAISAERPPEPTPSPKPPPPPPAPSSNRFSHFNSHDLSSDSDDDADFDMDYGNNVDSAGQAISGHIDSTKSKNELKDYSTPVPFYLPFGGHTVAPNLQRKINKICNHRARHHASARTASSAIPTSISKLIKAVTHAYDTSSEVCHFTSEDADEACADSGATDVMLPDFGAFISYHQCVNCFAILGDETPLPILGKGTSKLSLNGKVIIIRNCLHVSGRRSPLYSLREHKDMPDCGASSFYNVGSYILFPDFTLRIDDTIDNLVCYKSIGRSPCNRLDYAQPRASRSTANKQDTPTIPEVSQDEDEESVATATTERLNLKTIRICTCTDFVQRPKEY